MPVTQENDAKTPPGTQVLDLVTSSGSSHGTTGEEENNDLDYDATKWYNKKLFGKLPAYSSGLSQVLMVSFVCFLCPGMYNALSGMGGAGLSSATLSNKANIALYSCFATFGFFSGTIVNTVGVRWSLAFGGTGYSIYIGSFLCYKHTGNEGFIIFAGAWLGLTAATLWAATSTCNISYPTEAKKGTYMFIFWAIFNLGGVIGSLIPLAQNMNNSSGDVTDGSYVAFLILTILGAFIALFMLPTKNVRRTDGTKVIYQKNPNIVSELTELVKLLFKEPWIVLLFPMFFASNFFYTYEQSDFAIAFTVRTRSLNSLLFWLMQMVGSYVIGFLLDLKRFSRRSRGIMGWITLFILTQIIWGIGMLWVKGRSRGQTISLIDFKEGRYIGPMFLYMFFGFFDAVWQCYSYWVMGALTNSARKGAIYAGWYKGLQSAGSAIAWSMDLNEKPYKTMYGTTWGLLAGSLVVAFPILYLKVSNTTEIEKDLKDIKGNSEEILNELNIQKSSTVSKELA